MKTNKEDLKKVATPERTKSWNPIPHYDIVNVVDEQLEQSKLTVISHSIELSNQTKRLFGSLVLEGDDESSRFMLGYRSSIDKSMAIGFCSGHHITVCSNMMFSGDYVTFRKHSGLITIDDVATLAHQAINVLPKEKAIFDARMDTYLKVALNDDAFKSVIWDLMVANVLRPSEFNRYLECVQQERELNEGQTLATVHNAFTRLYRDKPIYRIMEYTPQLTAITDSYTR